MTDQQQRPMSAAQRTLFAALDGVIDEAVGAFLGQMREQHVRWHRDHKNEPSNGCHACVLTGIAQAPQTASPGALDEAQMRATLDAAPAPVGYQGPPPAEPPEGSPG